MRFSTIIDSHFPGKSDTGHWLQCTTGMTLVTGSISMCFRGSAAAVIVYDITLKESFQQAKGWIQELQSYVDPNIVLALAGNKFDLGDHREVETEVAQEFAKANNCIFMETSAKTGHSVHELFTEIAKLIPKGKRIHDFHDGFKIDTASQLSKINCCVR